ncbi:DUF1835 domain-containing protein [Lysinibacillus sp. 54212]|uniref:DUF1835 domain-containing protein n=1 Tax=Lysinibacillus sp. 54212 TaxID=3119829 RepID=UPI002FCB4240
MEQNIVLVYEFKTQNYITQLDFINLISLYEIHTEDEFDQFNHENYNPMAGGVYLELEDTNQMVAEINNKIQKQRANFQSLQQGPIHLVMSESAAGSLRVGLPRPKTVIGIPDSFDSGPLWQLDKKTGLMLRNEWLYDHINDEQEDGEYLNRFNRALRQMEDISTNVPIFIWYSDNEDEQVGFRFILYLLKEKGNDIFLMNTTELYREVGQPIFHTSQMDSDNLRLLFENNSRCKPLSEKQLLRFHAEWEELAETDGLLRIWDGGNIQHVSENYYDSYIIESVKKLHKKQGQLDWIRTAKLLEELLQDMKISKNIFYLEYRIRHLINNGLLELKGIPKSMRHYSIKLR